MSGRKEWMPTGETWLDRLDAKTPGVTIEPSSGPTEPRRITVNVAEYILANREKHGYGLDDLTISDVVVTDDGWWQVANVGTAQATLVQIPHTTPPTYRAVQAEDIRAVFSFHW